jgi:hypothetical protein
MWLSFIDNKPVACSCFKKYDANTIEIKRMFVALMLEEKDWLKSCYLN